MFLKSFDNIVGIRTSKYVGPFSDKILEAFFMFFLRRTDRQTDKHRNTHNSNLYIKGPSRKQIQPCFFIELGN